MIDKPTIARIMDSTKIEEVVSEFVTLKKRGINYIGLCPFHNDSHPSFSVSPTRGICHCFTCGKGGNAINFLMELEQMTYPDALRWLAKKYNIEIQEREMTILVGTIGHSAAIDQLIRQKRINGNLHQCGIENVVANSGTALSIHQIRLLHRVTSKQGNLYRWRTSRTLSWHLPQR